ncbi:hypothetical protein Celaphus_00017211 [Cervus elaphus hippelaphus]|uniref:Uncharacterized protein n=1 Tax=Cervus elaphus hippelaphus TaxID=46360 RepID=A0A212D5N2_CEREH|nr:hypothetical protein Celaphus_00017211 [Cervus elaphus hippelaphus]
MHGGKAENGVKSHDTDGQDGSNTASKKVTAVDRGKLKTQEAVVAPVPSKLSLTPRNSGQKLSECDSDMSHTEAPQGSL